ncbi:hypothetical protein F4604DRAFT_1584998, partial [Suillus subluteus]
SLQHVLVTGGAGYIGSHVIYTLQQTRRYKVISVDNYHYSFPASLTCVAASPEHIKSIFEHYDKGGIWGIVHIAVYKVISESVEIPLMYYMNNGAATMSLLQTMSDFDCTHIVYSSSATVYGTPPVIPPEMTCFKADSPYGKTIVMSEMVIATVSISYSEPNRWCVISLCYFNPADAHPSGLIGEGYVKHQF